MNLAARKTARLRDDFVMRFGAVMIAVALLVGTLYQPPKAKAFAATATMVVTVAACFLASCGITWLVVGADETGFNDAVGGLLQDYLDTEFAGQTVMEWAGDFTGIVMSGSKLLLPKLIAQKLGAFAGWVVNNYNLTVGGSNAIVQAGHRSLPLANGMYFKISDKGHSTGSFVSIGSDLVFSSGAKFVWSGDCCSFYKADGTFYSSFLFRVDDTKVQRLLITVWGDTTFAVANQWVGTDGTVYSPSYDWTALKGCDYTLLGNIVNAGEIVVSPSVALDISKPGTMADDDSLAIDTAITAGTLAELLERINAALRANELTTTQEVVKEQVKPGEVTDVNDLGLPSLSAIITTRFPFSIPWDVVRGIQLVAAPPEAPYWKVDFLAPIASRVGGWKGDTSVEIDMGKYPIIGQFCRWTSTIGFCLVLAMGTKKLTWVA